MSWRQSTRTAGRRRRFRLVVAGGGDGHVVRLAGGDVSSQLLLGAHPPAASPKPAGVGGGAGPGLADAV